MPFKTSMSKTNLTNNELQDMMEAVGLQNYNWKWEKQNTSQPWLKNRFELSVTCQKVNK